jgi:hypothetical protein
MNRNYIALWVSLIDHLTSTVVAIIIINRPTKSRSSLEFDLFYVEDDDSGFIRFLSVCYPQADGAWGHQPTPLNP